MSTFPVSELTWIGPEAFARRMESILHKLASERPRVSMPFVDVL
jgi:hypothetical protein